MSPYIRGWTERSLRSLPTFRGCAMTSDTLQSLKHSRDGAPAEPADSAAAWGRSGSPSARLDRQQHGAQGTGICRWQQPCHPCLSLLQHSHGGPVVRASCSGSMSQPSPTWQPPRVITDARDWEPWEHISSITMLGMAGRDCAPQHTPRCLKNDGLLEIRRKTF